MAQASSTSYDTGCFLKISLAAILTVITSEFNVHVCLIFKTAFLWLSKYWARHALAYVLSRNYSAVFSYIHYAVAKDHFSYSKNPTAIGNLLKCVPFHFQYNAPLSIKGDVVVGVLVDIWSVGLLVVSVVAETAADVVFIVLMVVELVANVLVVAPGVKLAGVVGFKGKMWNAEQFLQRG